jgi:SPP1 family predicted phage head-tail adaptor
MPAIAELDQRVALQTRTSSPDVDGSLTEGFTSVATVWAKVRQIIGGRYLLGQQVTDKRTHRITARRHDDQRSITHLTWSGRRFAVRLMLESSDRRFVHFLVEELGDA